MSTKFCLNCKNPLNTDALFCPKCGTKVEGVAIASHKVEVPPKETAKSSQVTLALCILLGTLGVHRFYVGKKWTGILMLLSCGGLGVWVLIDLILIIKNKFEDKQGRTLELTHNLSPLKENILVAGAIITWFAVCMATIVAILMYSTTALVNVVDNQLYALRNGNIELAYSYNSNNLKQNLSIDGFRRLVEQFPALKNNESSHFDVRKILNNAGFLSGTLTAKDGVKTPVEYQLISESGSWKIFNIKVVGPVNGAVNHPAQ